MNYYRITKYNPEFRNEQGFYTKNDWTSISDIGQVFDEGVLTAEDYKQMEDSYIKALNIVWGHLVPSPNGPRPQMVPIVLPKNVRPQMVPVDITYTRNY